MLKLKEVKAHLTLDKWKQIGEEGRNSDVWIARDKQIEQMLILKIITKESLRQQFVDDYFIESKVLNDSIHPHIMPTYYSAEDEENIYITMPYFQSGSLNSIIDKKMLTVREIIKYSLDFLSGLLFIHIKGLLHLDIKPSNIIIDDTDRAILTDFGLSRYLNERGFAEQPLQYNTHRSPEAYITNDRTQYDDIYQAGLTLYRLCNGNSSFQIQYKQLRLRHNNDNTAIIKEIEKGKFPDRQNYLPHIPNQLKRIINKMLQVDVSKRYKDVLTIINDLGKIKNMLDWQYCYSDKYKTMTWTNTNNTAVHTGKLQKDNDVYLTSGSKYVKKSGNTLNQNIFKGDFDSLDMALKFIQETLPKQS